MHKQILNLVGFNAGWFACVLGAANGQPWIGVIAVSVLAVIWIGFTRAPKSMLALVLAAAAMGYVLDSGLTLAGVLTFDEEARLGGPAPLWMVAMWVNFAVALPISMAWIIGRYGIGALLGATGGPLAYLAGDRLGAVEIPTEFSAWLLITLEWAVAMPALIWMTGKLDPMRTPRKAHAS